jgi:hypothetical protein
VESHIYCVGVRAEEISDVVTWGINRRITATLKGNGKYDFDVEVDHELDRPIVHAEKRNSRGLSRHSIKEYIDRIVPVKALIDFRANSEKSTQFYYILDVNRENVDFLWNSESLSLFNHPRDENEMEATSYGMAMLFGGRQDCYACQSRNPGKNGKMGFRKKKTSINIACLITGHLKGFKTIGFYPFDAEDQCYYCAIDVQERDEAMKLSNFLLDNDLPVLVEKLVSADSYHIWIPIIPIKTLSVYKFSRQILHDAGVKGADVYPRQRSINSCHNGSCGDFLMLPLGIYQEKNRISEFIDPRSFETVDRVDVEKVVSLREVPEFKAVIPLEEDDQE